MCARLAHFSIAEHAKDLRAPSISAVLHLYLRLDGDTTFHSRNGGQNAYQRHTESTIICILYFEIKVSPLNLSNAEISPRRCSLLQGSLVPVRRLDGYLLVDVNFVAGVGDDGNRIEVLLPFHYQSAATTDYDPLSTGLFEVFDAKKSHQPDFQVNSHESNVFYRWITCFKLVWFFAIFRRSSQQIYNVTLFYLFFMSLYGLLGVQFFGELKNHCVLNTTKNEYIFIFPLFLKLLSSCIFQDSFRSTRLRFRTRSARLTRTPATNARVA